MPVVKGGVWTNIEDEILKASVSKYGLNQWARVSSLLARKTPKQCKARWTEWLDPSIRKIEWSKEEDEKLLHLAKILPTQWRTIAPLVGRTATQCLERYQRLLDDAEARENDELGLSGPAGGETSAPSADDVRRLQPGEHDPDPESKPAKPDTIDLDEDEKEMLSEARARLANTQGKKAKRKARERQLEESRRLAVLQKRRELKNAGINIKVVTRKPGQMDYNADIPFEKAPAPGFYDTAEEESINEHQRQMFDPRKQQLANKRKGDQDEGADDRKKKQRKDGKEDDTPASFQQAVNAAKMQKMREAERSSKRKGLALPAPQVSEGELEDIVKMGMSGSRASQAAGESDNQATRSLVGNYSAITSQTPIRTPLAPREQDRVANEVRNARARTETQSALLGGENPDLHEGSGTTGYEGVTPSKQQLSTPNPMATPVRGANGAAATPSQNEKPGATPLRTPRDSFRLNDQTPSAVQLAHETPREQRLREAASKNTLRGRLAALPKPKETEWELELPEEQAELAATPSQSEDQAVRDERARAAAVAAERADFRRQTQVVQRGLPRPTVNLKKQLADAAGIADASEREVALEAVRLAGHDAQRFGGLSGQPMQGLDVPALEAVGDEALERARLEVVLEADVLKARRPSADAAAEAWRSTHRVSLVPGLDAYADDQDEGAPRDALELDAADRVLLGATLSGMAAALDESAARAARLEKRLTLTHGGYQQRNKMLRKKLVDASAALEDTRRAIETRRLLQLGEEAAISARLERLRLELATAARRERAAQDQFRLLRDELDGLKSGAEP